MSGGGGGGNYASWIGGAGAHLQTYAAEVSPASIQYKRELYQDTKRMRRGNLGWQEAAKANMLGNTSRALNAQSAGFNAGLDRSANAAGTSGRAGSYFGNRLQGYKQNSGAMGAASLGVEQGSANFAAQEKASILGRLRDQYHNVQNMQQRNADISMAATGSQGSGTPSYSAEDPNKRKKKEDEVVTQFNADDAATPAAGN